MPPIDPSELSAFIDGELTAERHEAVRAALAQDAALRLSYERLLALDAQWTAQAATAKFTPQVRLNGDVTYGRLATVAAAVGLIGMRIAIKTPPPIVGVSLELILLALVVGWGFRRIMRIADADRSRLHLATES